MALFTVEMGEGVRLASYNCNLFPDGRNERYRVCGVLWYVCMCDSMMALLFCSCRFWGCRPIILFVTVYDS